MGRLAQGSKQGQGHNLNLSPSTADEKPADRQTTRQPDMEDRSGSQATMSTFLNGIWGMNHALLEKDRYLKLHRRQ